MSGRKGKLGAIGTRATRGDLYSGRQRLRDDVRADKIGADGCELRTARQTSDREDRKRTPELEPALPMVSPLLYNPSFEPESIVVVGWSTLCNAAAIRPPTASTVSVSFDAKLRKSVTVS